MNQTHYEKILSSGLFPTEEVFEILQEELPDDNFTFEQFVDTEFIQGMVDRSPAQREKELNSVVQMLFHIYSYYVGMGRTYEVREELGEMLLNTKLDVDSRMVKSPFREIQILVPPILKLHNNDTGLHDISTIYVNFREVTDTNKLVKILCVGRPNQNSVHEFDDAIFFFRIPLDGGKVSEAMKREIEEWKQSPNFGKFSEDPEYDVGLIPRLFQFILNVLLYITSENSDIRLQKSRMDELRSKLAGLKSTAKIKKLRGRIDKESSIHRYIVGADITLSPEERELYDSLKHSGPRVRFPVGGHWRLQWVGKQGSQVQKPTWVRPHFRGPELAELVKNIGVMK